VARDQQGMVLSELEFGGPRARGAEFDAPTPRARTRARRETRCDKITTHGDCETFARAHGMRRDA